MSFSLSWSNSYLIGEIVEKLHEHQSDGTLEYSQVQYIINELNLEPNCAEISELFKNLKFSTFTIHKLIQIHCNPSKKSKKKPSKSSKPASKTRVRASLQNKIKPKNPGPTDSYSKLSLNTSDIEIKLRNNSPEYFTSYRKARVEKMPVELELGDIILWESLPFVNGRYFWPGQSNHPENLGLLHSKSPRYNGAQMQFATSAFQHHGYASWNKNQQNSGRLDAVLMGGSTQLQTQHSAFILQSQFSSLDKISGQDEQFLTHGVQWKGTGSKEFSLGLGHSLYQPHQGNQGNQGKARFKSREQASNQMKNTYFEMGYRLPDKNTQVHLFQGLSGWQNPFTDLNKKVTDTTLHGTPIRGKGEGGVEFQSLLPLIKKEVQLSLLFKSKVHWFRGSSHLKYRHHNLSLAYQKSLLKTKISMTSTMTDTTYYMAVNPTLRWNLPHISPGAAYSQKFGNYQGEYKHSLELYAWILHNQSNRFKVKLKWKDIFKYPATVKVMLYQQGKLPGNFAWETSIFLPIEGVNGLRVTDELTYKVLIKADFKI